MEENIDFPASQAHPLLGITIQTLSSSFLPSKLHIINYIRFKIDSSVKKQ